MQELGNKVAVVTGAGNGIGLAIAARLAREGMRVALADIEDGALDSAAASLVAAGIDESNVLTRQTDVTSEADVDALADHVFDTWGQVDILVNNAGVFVGGVLWERPAADLEFVLGVNVWGILHGIRAFVPRMIAQGTEGHIVNTCSIAGHLPGPFGGPYTISKFAALAATESLAHDLAVTGSKLKVTAVCPGMVNTGLDESSERTRPDSLAAASTPDRDFALEVISDWLQGGIDPADLADSILDAIHDEQFLLFTHDHHPTEVVARAERFASTGALPNPGEYR